MTYAYIIWNVADFRCLSGFKYHGYYRCIWYYDICMIYMFFIDRLSKHEHKNLKFESLQRTTSGNVWKVRENNFDTDKKINFNNFSSLFLNMLLEWCARTGCAQVEIFGRTVIRTAVMRRLSKWLFEISYNKARRSTIRRFKPCKPYLFL